MREPSRLHVDSKREYEQTALTTKRKLVHGHCLSPRRARGALQSFLFQLQVQPVSCEVHSGPMLLSALLYEQRLKIIVPERAAHTPRALYISTGEVAADPFARLGCFCPSFWAPDLRLPKSGRAGMWIETAVISRHGNVQGRGPFAIGCSDLLRDNIGIIASVASQDGKVLRNGFKRENLQVRVPGSGQQTVEAVIGADIEHRADQGLRF